MKNINITNILLLILSIAICLGIGFGIGKVGRLLTQRDFGGNVEFTSGRVTEARRVLPDVSDGAAAAGVELKAGLDYSFDVLNSRLLG